MSAAGGKVCAMRTTDRLMALLNLRTWIAYDVDADGRVLTGWDDAGSLQLVEIDTDGTQRSLTALPSRCAGRYIPGRRQVVVSHDNGGDEKMQLSLLDIDAVIDGPAGLQDLTPLVHDSSFIHVLHDVTATSLVYSTNRRNGVDFDVIVRDLDSGEERVVYDEGGYVADTSVSHDCYSTAITQLSPQPASTAVSVVGKHAAGQEGLVTDPNEHAHHGSGFSELSVGWTADDSALVMASNHHREFKGIARVSLDGQSWEWLVDDGAADHIVSVAPDASAMVVGRMVDGACALAVHEMDGTRRCPVDLPEGIPTVVWSTDSRRLAVTVMAPTVPCSIYTVDATTGESHVVVDSQAAAGSLAATFVRPAVHRVPTPDGEQVPCFVYAPAPEADVDPAVAGSSVIHVHGGPEAAATQMFNPLVQALVAAGVTVLVPNVRGSTGYGKRWYSLDDVEQRLDSVADLAALHAYLPTLGLDPERCALWGGSYGGYMVLAGVAMQPDLWAAGVDIVGISSLVTFLENTSAYRRAYREREYGSLQSNRDFLVKASPITYLDDMRTPLFIIHGANDPRVPLTEAEQIKAALDGRGVECEMRVYADEGHGLAKRANRVDAYVAAVDFLTRHLSTGHR